MEINYVKEIIEGYNITNTLFIPTNSTHGYCVYYYIPVKDRMIFMVRDENENDSILRKILPRSGVSGLIEISFSEFRSLNRSEIIKKILTDD